MSQTVHLIVEDGPEKGRHLTVPHAGARIGRSSKNDITIVDPVLSRHHCRVYFKDDETLWITDLGSANETLVNGAPASEAKLNNGDAILIGDTLIRVVGDRRSGITEVDLGLSQDLQKRPETRESKLLVPVLVGILIAIVALLFVVLAPNRPSSQRHQAGTATDVRTAPPDYPRTLEVVFERVEATETNIFRYHLEINKDGLLSVQIDDIAHQSHARKSAQMTPEYLEMLRESLEDTGFTALQGEYSGRAPGHSVTDISLTIGRMYHRSVMRNYEDAEPLAFRNAREILEEVAKNELQLHPILFEPARRIAMGQEAYLTAKKMYNERLVQPSNLHSAIKQLENAMWYLESISPKPDFYPDLLDSIHAYRQELRDRYEELRFQAERAMRSNEWADARSFLQRIRSLIPDPADERHDKARKSLLEVERRLSAMN